MQAQLCDGQICTRLQVSNSERKPRQYSKHSSEASILLSLTNEGNDRGSKFCRPPLMLNYHQPSSTIGRPLPSGPLNFSNLKLWVTRIFELATSNLAGYAHPIHQPVFRPTARCSTRVPVADLKIITTQTKQCLSPMPLLRPTWPVIDRRTISQGPFHSDPSSPSPSSTNVAYPFISLSVPATTVI